ncbi:MAG: ABC transporter permease [Promethearchaeota archaeon]
MGLVKIALSNLGRQKGRTGLTILAVVLGSALLTGITILNDSYLDSYLDGVSSILGKTDLAVRMHENNSAGYFTEASVLNESGVDIRTIRGYVNHTTRLNFQQDFTSYEGIDAEYAYETSFVGLDPARDRGFGYVEFVNWSDDVAAERGSGWEPGEIEDVIEQNASWVVITSWVKDVYNLSIDQQIYVYSRGNPNSEKTNSSTWDKYFVKAIVNDFAEGQEVNYNPDKDEAYHYLNSRVIFMDIDGARQVLNKSADTINLVFVQVKLKDLNKAEQDLLQMLATKSGTTDDGFYGENIKGAELTAVRNSVRSMAMILVIFTIISTIVAIILITNTLLMSVQEQRYETGVLRAMGVYKREVFKMFFAQAFFIALVGSTIGVLAGMGLSPLFKRMFFKTLELEGQFRLKITYNLLPILVTYGVNFLMTSLVGILPATISTRLKIVEAIHNLKPARSGRRVMAVLFPLVGVAVAGASYYYLKTHQRQLVPSLTGIIPFILGLIVLCTVLTPVLAKGISLLIGAMLKPFRQLTERNFERDPRQTKVSFTMFAMAISFLVMVSNILTSVERIQIAAAPRFIGSDLVLSSEGTTFGMADILEDDQEFIKGAVAHAAQVSGLRVKVDGYGTYANETSNEPRVTMYIIEPDKFVETVNQITMRSPTNQTTAETWGQLDSTNNGVIATYQLLDKNHLDKGVGDSLEVDLGGGFVLNGPIVGVTEFVAGFSESWEDRSDILPADRDGQYAIWVSWNSAIALIEEIFKDYPGLHLCTKKDDFDLDFWDFPLINATDFRQKLQPLESAGLLSMAERVWDENTSSIICDRSYEEADIPTLYGDPSKYQYVHTVFENTSIKGMATFVKKRYDAFQSVQDALDNGTDQCVITKDIYENTGLDVDDQVSVWCENSSDPGSLVRENFTIAAIVDISQTIEAWNFNTMNPYITGNNDVAADDSTAVVVKNVYPEFQAALLNHTSYFEFWIRLSDYYNDHLRIVDNISSLLGDEFVTVDVKWMFTKDYSYAPGWIVDVDENVTDQEDAIERIKTFLLSRKMPAIAWTSTDGLVEQYRSQFDFQKSFFNVVLSFALVIAVLGIMINMLMAVNNRTREIGVLRAVGTYKKEVLKMILGETLILVLIGMLLGTALGILSSRVLLHGLPLDTVFGVWLTIDWRMIGILFGVVLVTAVVCALLPARRAMKIDIVEAIYTI